MPSDYDEPALLPAGASTVWLTDNINDIVQYRMRFEVPGSAFSIQNSYLSVLGCPSCCPSSMVHGPWSCKPYFKIQNFRFRIQDLPASLTDCIRDRCRAAQNSPIEHGLSFIHKSVTGVPA